MNAPRTAVHRRSPLTAFAGTVVAAVFFKLWLTSDIRTSPMFAPHDASNFIEHAKSLAVGHWFGQYNDLTLIKGPFFPIYLAIVHETGLSLPMMHVLLTAASCLLVCLAVWPLVRKSGVLAALFLFLFFDPFTYNTDAWLAMRSQVNPSLALLCAGCATAMLVRRRAAWQTGLPWAIGLGVSFAAFWLNREEALWLLPCLLIILAPYLVLTVRSGRHEMGPRLALLAIPVVAWLVAVNTIATINGAVYGWRTVTEIQAPEFVAAYSSLERLDPDNTNVASAVSKTARLQAYRISPAARELQPFIEAGVGDNWRQMSCGGIPTCTDIAAPLFGFALRDAAVAAGHYASGADARAYYARIAEEIDRACDIGQVRCSPKRGLFLPVGLAAHASDLIAAFAAGGSSLVHLTALDMSRPPYFTPPEGIREDYEFVVRSVDLAPERFILGWLVHKPMRNIEITGSLDPSGNAIAFHASPDIASALGPRLTRQGFDTADARFQIKTTCLTGCTLVLTDQHGTTTRIPLSADTNDYKSATAIYHVDNAVSVDANSFDDGARNAIRIELAQAYQWALPPLLSICVLLIGLRLARVARGARVPSYLFVVLGVLVSAGALIAILSVIVLLGLQAFKSEYMGAMFSLMFLAGGLTISSEGTAYYRLLRKKMGAAWSGSHFSSGLGLR